MAGTDFATSIVIGIAVVGISAVLCPWLANEYIAPFILDQAGLDDPLLDMAVTVGVMILLALVLWKLGLTWGNVADSGLWGVLAGMVVVAWAGPERVIYTGIGLVASWVVTYLLNRHKLGPTHKFPIVPFLYIAIFTASFVAINVLTGDTESMWENEKFIWVVYLPVFLVVALPMVSKGGYILAEIMCCLGTATYALYIYAGLNGLVDVGDLDDTWVLAVTYFLVFTIAGMFVAYSAYKFGKSERPDRYDRSRCGRISPFASSRTSSDEHRIRMCVLSIRPLS